MRMLSYRFATSPWFARLLSMLAFAAIGGSFIPNALAFHGGSASGSLILPDGSVVQCNLTVVNSEFLEGQPAGEVTIQQLLGKPITCLHYEPDNLGHPIPGTLSIGQVPGVAGSLATIHATNVFPSGACTNTPQGGSQQRYAATCGTVVGTVGTDVTFTFEITFTSCAPDLGPVCPVTKFFKGGGATELSPGQCGNFFPKEGVYQKPEMVDAIMGYDVQNCSLPLADAKDSSLFNFRACTASDLGATPSCFNKSHVASAQVEQFIPVDADVRDKVNNPGCPASGVLKVTLDGADLSSSGFSASTVDQSSFFCGNPDDLRVYKVPNKDVTFKDTASFPDGIPDAVVTCARCNGPITVIAPNGQVTVTATTTGALQSIEGTTSAAITPAP